MSPRTEQLPWRRMHTAGLWYLVITFIIRRVETTLPTGYAGDPLAGLWSFVVPLPYSSSIVLLAVSVLFAYAAAFTLSAVFSCMHEWFGTSYWAKSMGFAHLMTVLLLIFGYFPSFFLFNAPPGLMAWSMATGWVTMIAVSMMFAWVLVPRR